MTSISPSLPDGYAACHAVIGDAINRCRPVGRLSRVTIVVKHVQNNPPSLLTSFEVSISDTGGDLAVMTTESIENEVRQYQISDAFNKARIMQLRSVPKESGSYCGTSISLKFNGYPEQLLLYIYDICYKIKVLMLKTIAIEVCVERLASKGSIFEDVLLLSEGITLPSELSNLERLSVGLAIHISDGLPERESVKIGKGSAVSSETTETFWVFEACFAVKEATDTGGTSMNTKCTETKVLFFQDFIGASITPTIINVLETKVNWNNYGLKVRNIQLNVFGTAIIEWEDLPRFGSIQLVLHRYKSTQTKPVSWSREVFLLKKCVEEALNDLKQQNPHLFLSHRSAELQKYVPDLSTCISRLISASSDGSFKASCADILGLESTDFETVELCVRAKLLKAIMDSDIHSVQEQKNQRKDTNRDSFRDEAEESVEDDEGEGDDYEDRLEGSSIWEYI